MGQSKDNIFNVKTPNDYPIELRKPRLGEVTANKILNGGLEKFLKTPITIKNKWTENDEEFLYETTFLPEDLYNRNKLLIDFNCIPVSLQKRILDVYHNYELPTPENIHTFFTKYGWTSFLENLSITESKLLSLY